jgi:hypothetical protein
MATPSTPDTDCDSGSRATSRHVARTTEGTSAATTEGTISPTMP